MLMPHGRLVLAEQVLGMRIYEKLLNLEECIVNRTLCVLHFGQKVVRSHNMHEAASTRTIVTVQVHGDATKLFYIIIYASSTP